jgi:hypothetical protein
VEEPKRTPSPATIRQERWQGVGSLLTGEMFAERAAMKLGVDLLNVPD